MIDDTAVLLSPYFSFVSSVFVLSSLNCIAFGEKQLPEKTAKCQSFHNDYRRIRKDRLEFPAGHFVQAQRKIKNYQCNIVHNAALRDYM